MKAKTTIIIPKHEKEIQHEGETWINQNYVSGILSWRTRAVSANVAGNMGWRWLYAFAETKTKLQNYRNTYIAKSDLESYALKKQLRKTPGGSIEDLIDKKIKEHEQTYHQIHIDESTRVQRSHLRNNRNEL